MNRQVAVAIRKLISERFGAAFQIVYENIDTDPPTSDHNMYLRLTISPAEKASPFLARDAKYEIFMVQVDIISERNIGTDSARGLSDGICNVLSEGLDIEIPDRPYLKAYISEDARSFPGLQNDTSYCIPVRCYCRVDIFN